MLHKSKNVYKYWSTTVVFLLVVFSRLFALAHYQLHELTSDVTNSFHQKSSTESQIHFSTNKALDTTDFVFINEPYEEELEEEENNTEEDGIDKFFYKSSLLSQEILSPNLCRQIVQFVNKIHHSKSHLATKHLPFFIIYSIYRI